MIYKFYTITVIVENTWVLVWTMRWFFIIRYASFCSLVTTNTFAFIFKSNFYLFIGDG